MIATGEPQSARTISAKGHAENRSIANKNNGIRKPGDKVAMGQSDRESLQSVISDKLLQDR